MLAYESIRITTQTIGHLHNGYGGNSYFSRNPAIFPRSKLETHKNRFQRFGFGFRVWGFGPFVWLCRVVLGSRQVTVRMGRLV